MPAGPKESPSTAPVRVSQAFNYVKHPTWNQRLRKRKRKSMYIYAGTLHLDMCTMNVYVSMCVCVRVQLYTVRTTLLQQSGWLFMFVLCAVMNACMPTDLTFCIGPPSRNTTTHPYANSPVQQGVAGLYVLCLSVTKHTLHEASHG